MTDIKTEPVDYCDDLDGFRPEIEDLALLINKNSIPCSSSSIKCEDDQYINYNNVISPKTHQICEPDPLDINGVSTETALQDSFHDSVKSKEQSQPKIRKLCRPKRGGQPNRNLSILKGGIAAIIGKKQNSDRTTASEFVPFPSDYLHSELLTQKPFPENLYVGYGSYKCENCFNRVFTVYRKFRSHRMKFHKMEPISFCDICNLPCGSNKALKTHKTACHNEDKELCGICNELISCSIISQHLKSVHNLSENPSSSISNVTYVGTVQEPKNASEDISKKNENNCKCYRLERRANRSQQNETSTGNNESKLSNEKCDRCGRNFVKVLKQKKYYKKYLPGRHLGPELKFIKSVNTFTQIDSNLSRHRPKSTFICYFLECYLVFQTQEDLDNHRTSHYGNVGLRRYKCEICSAKYLKLRDLQSHQQHSHLQTSPSTKKTISKKIASKSQSDDLISSFIDSIAPHVRAKRKTPSTLSAEKVLPKSENKDESSTKMCHVCLMEFKTWIGLQCHQKVAKHE